MKKANRGWKLRSIAIIDKSRTFFLGKEDALLWTGQSYIN
jgi:hypothetical protein